MRPYATRIAAFENMSVPPRTVLTVAREAPRGRRYRVDFAQSLAPGAAVRDLEALTRRLRTGAVDVLLELLGTGRSAVAPERRLRALCERAVGELSLPGGFGFFVDEPAVSRIPLVGLAAAIGLLAARSGPLYLPGRFEPSLITPKPVTLFFPVLVAGGDVEEGR
jgi:hypothetical protein